MHRMPMSLMDHGACYLDNPQPNLSPEMSMEVFPSLDPSLLRTKYSLGMANPGPIVATSLTFLYCSSANIVKPNPERCMVFSNYLAMIVLVSMLCMLRVSVLPFRVLILGSTNTASHLS